MSGKVIFALCAGFLFGIFLRSFFALSWPFAAALGVFGFFALVYQLTDTSKRNICVLAAIFLFACATGIMRMDAAKLEGDPALSARIGNVVTIEGYIFEEPDVRERGVRLMVRANTLIYQSATTSIDSGVLVLAPPHAQIVYGDLVRAKGKLQLPEKFDTGAGRTFNYPMFLAKDGILYQLAFAEVESLGENRGNIFKKAALAIKHVYLKGLGSALPEPSAALAAGITVGDKRSLGEELTDTFQTVSLVHIIVLSGYNMTVVINAAAHVLAFVPRYGQFTLSGVIVGLFVLMTGGAASATRAGAMALLATYARLTGRTFLALRILALVAAAMVLWNPYFLAFDPGFQLSVLATAGLILFTPLISSRLSSITERFGLREIVASTLGTQIAVLPLLLYQNGLLSFVALPANVLTLIFVPLAMLFSAIAAIAGALIGVYATPLAFPALVLLTYIVKVAEILAALPFASVTVPAFSVWLMLVMYAALAVVYFFYQKNEPED